MSDHYSEAWTNIDLLVHQFSVGIHILNIKDFGFFLLYHREYACMVITNIDGNLCSLHTFIQFVLFISNHKSMYLLNFCLYNFRCHPAFILWHCLSFCLKYCKRGNFCATLFFSRFKQLPRKKPRENIYFVYKLM